MVIAAIKQTGRIEWLNYDRANHVPMDYLEQAKDPMNHPSKLLPAALVAATAVFLLTIPLAAQVPEGLNGGQADSKSDDATPDLTVAEVEAELAAMEADSGLEDAVKQSLRPKYKQAIQALKDAADNAGKAVSYREAIKKVPEHASAALNALQTLVRRRLTS